MGGQNYEIGYKKPPKETRFKKGQSGNPKGRPKKPPMTTYEAFEHEMQRLISITENGIKTKIPVFQAIWRMQVALALKGDGRAAAHMLKLWNEFELRYAPPPQPREMVVRFMTPEEAEQYRNSPSSGELPER